MTLDEFLQKLSYTHLAELSIAGEGSGQIKDEHLPKFIARVNEGLLAMYARFPLRKKTLSLRTYESITEYFLRPEFALFSGSTEEVKYLIDSDEVRFPNDILMITDIVDEDGEGLNINDRNEETSWHFTGFDSLVTAEPESDKYFVIQYHAMPVEIGFGPLNPRIVQIPIPRILEAALLLFVAGHVYGNMSMEGALTKSQHFLDMYENECKIIEERNLLNSSISITNMKPSTRGWP